MSRIGNKPIEIKAGVTINQTDDVVKVTGPKGTLEIKLRPEVGISIKEGILHVEEKKPSKKTSAFMGMTRALLNNMVNGVTEGFEKKLELVGVGYRAKQNGTDGAVLSVGYSHPVDFKAPNGVQIEVIDNQFISVKGADKQLVGLTASKMRKVRKPEPYKGKGIKYAGEVIRRKQGKTGKV
ncbi:50S ribosomal protein L6 [candidate division WWE3 bacterium RIFOXYC1_FULL_39_7]|uniref:Large ribosomal subunit protein uL6 n=2 Tax=Katanobacteria TaxID=422282 RepID=A0A1F4X5T3_UNCKA|nr:MAG: 50S ribosomal protein L6 [candidate division WWE3 bacterium RIFOXYC1_FULL_39_7]OGC76483.1 MAG: 50S ribosomal protein L6 [candidate division WWE3 bacterium RIFOXYD1_FULL_39_9]